jgi:hypothetical protein
VRKGKKDGGRDKKLKPKQTKTSNGICCSKKKKYIFNVIYVY